MYIWRNPKFHNLPCQTWDIAVILSWQVLGARLRSIRHTEESQIWNRDKTCILDMHSVILIIRLMTVRLGLKSCIRHLPCFYCLAVNEYKCVNLKQGGAGGGEYMLSKTFPCVNKGLENCQRVSDTNQGFSCRSVLIRDRWATKVMFKLRSTNWFFCLSVSPASM